MSELKDPEMKHKTIGVSFHPLLRDKASDRAAQLGLSFSKYVTLCVEAELKGNVPTLLGDEPSATYAPNEGVTLDTAIERGTRYGEAKAASSEFANDIEAILKAHDYSFTREEKIAHLRADFLVQYVENKGKGKTRSIALECSHNIRNRYEIALGQAILLKSMPNVDAVIICVPYLSTFDPQMRATFLQNGIPTATPDSLVQTLEESLMLRR